MLFGSNRLSILRAPSWRYVSFQRILLLERTFGRLRSAASYRTVDVICSTCRIKLFKYKKKNGKSSGLVKLFFERIVADPYEFKCLFDDCTVNNTNYSSDSTAHGNLKSRVVASTSSSKNSSARAITVEINDKLCCPGCQSKWGRIGVMHGNKVFRIAGNKLSMT